VSEHPDVDLAPVVVNEISVLGSRCGPFAPALRALESGSVDPLPLVSDRFDLRYGARALRRAAARGALKVLLEP
jgi:threonine dehydrogenase-like Zn-dependent dehydrogenase